MPGGIFLLDPAGELTKMAKTDFAAELDLQELLARHPDLLAGDQIDPGTPRRWLLISREVGIPDQEQGGSRWALDHLFLDQDGVPTPLQTWITKRCEREGLDPDQQLAAFLDGTASAGDFWQRVKTNLQAGKVRLLFASDNIPSELRRIVEFLNQQMDPAEVLAVEIRQYLAKSLKTLVPRVLGQTTETLTRKSTGTRETRQWDEPTFFADLTCRTSEEEDKSRLFCPLGWHLFGSCILQDRRVVGNNFRLQDAGIMTIEANMYEAQG